MERDFTGIDIENEKVRKIIIAAMEVFSQNDYEKASTNLIVKKAGVSRGILYYYFKDKNDLFDFLFYYSGKVYVENMEKSIDWNDTDYLNRIKSLVMSKTDIILQHPYMVNFIDKNYENYSPKKLNRFSEDENSLRNKVLEYNVDFSSIKGGVDIEMFKKLCYYSIDGEIKAILDVNGIQSLPSKRDEILHSIIQQINFYRKYFYN